MAVCVPTIPVAYSPPSVLYESLSVVRQEKNIPMLIGVRSVFMILMVNYYKIVKQI